MTITPILPDQAAPQRTIDKDQSSFAKLLDGVSGALGRADRAEDAFAAHAGSLQDAVLERAQPHEGLSVATVAAQRSVQALQSILNMQI